MYMSKIWVNGCFDVLHIGHIRLFKYAKSLGGFLRVGTDSDERIKQNKGRDRPYNNQDIRVEFLNSIGYIDEVVVFNSDEELENCIKTFSPKLIVIGDEYKNKQIIGQEHAEGITFFTKVDNYSTSSILNGDKL